MECSGERWQIRSLDLRVLAVLAGAKLLVHVMTSGRYGYFRDELYFLDCARHLDWGYVDHAPLVALYAKVALLLGGRCRLSDYCRPSLGRPWWR